MRNLRLKHVLMSTTLLSLTSLPLVLAAPASAQQGGETVIITGTRILQEGYVSSSPITTIDAEELALKNPVDVEEVLRQMPQFGPGNGGQVNNGSSGASTLDLRGLTEPRTLPLIDGKRMVAFDPNGLFDVTAIPIALLERIDVVTGGASAVYGSDAVAGVVNFILNDDFQGAQLDTAYSITDHGDGEVVSVQGTIGASLDGGRGNVAFSLGYLDKESVYQSRGPGAATPGASSTTIPTAIDSAVGGRSQISATGQLVPFYQGFDYNPQNLYQTPQTRWNATALGKYDINDHVQAYSRFIYSNSHSAPQIASSGTFGFTFSIPVNNPFLTTQAASYLTTNNTVGTCAALNEYSVTAPAGNCVNVGVRWRALDVGPRQYSYSYDTFQSLIGVRGDFMGWDWDIAGAHGESSQRQTQGNDISADRVQQAFFAANQTTCTDTSSFCAPLNLFNPAIPITQAALDFIRFNLQIQSLTKQDYVTAVASRDLGDFKSPWAMTPIAVSVGAEYRQESSDYQPDAAAQSGSSPGFGQTLPISGEYDVLEGFGEAIIPLVENQQFIKSMNLELGYRHSDYSTSGGVETYKYGADWTPIEGLRFRGMFQRAVRAANINELFSPVTPGTGDLLIDPCANGSPTSPIPAGPLRSLCVATGVPLGALTGGTLSQPTAGQVNNFTGGNANVSPEEADTKTFGFVWQPEQIKNLGITVDYYDIQVDNAISIRPIFDIVDACYNSARNTALAASNFNCALIKRNPLNGTMEGNLIYGVSQVTQNIGEVHVEGIDYSVQYAWDLGSLGGLEFALDGTHVIDSSYIPSPGGASVDCVGHYGKQCGLPSTVSASTGGPTPEDHMVFRTTWSYGNFDVSGIWRYLSGSTVDASQAGVTDPISASIGDYNYLDLAGSWQITDWARLKLSVANVTDEDAPFVQTESGATTFNSGNTYPSTYDPLGRIFTVGLTTKF